MSLLLRTVATTVVTVPAASKITAAAEPSGFDVVVVGATPGGTMAAVAAGRAGRRTLLLEPSAYVGGMMAGGLGLTDFGVHPDTIGGQALEFFRRCPVQGSSLLGPKCSKTFCL